MLANRTFSVGLKGLYMKVERWLSQRWPEFNAQRPHKKPDTAQLDTLVISSLVRQRHEVL